VKIVCDLILDYDAIEENADDRDPKRGPGIEVARAISAGVRWSAAWEDAKMHVVLDAADDNAASREGRLHRTTS
jgi:hypothetical protein